MTTTAPTSELSAQPVAVKPGVEHSPTRPLVQQVPSNDEEQGVRADVINDRTTTVPHADPPAGAAAPLSAAKDEESSTVEKSYDSDQSRGSPLTQNGVPCQHDDNNPVPVTYKATKTPTSTLNAVYEAGKYKAGLPLDLLCIQSFMAGIYISMAGHLFLAVGGGVLGSMLFPTGLIAVTLTSAELFTGDALVFVAAVLGGKVTIDKLARNWTVAWTMNFVGGLFWAYLIAYASDALEDSGQRDFAYKVAIKKADQSFMHIFLKAVAANFMVCLGVWQATCSEQVAGKILALWFPISGFVIMGFEHSIANQFFIPLGMMLGAYDDGSISIADLFYALAAATIGNAVGGGLLVGAVYWYVYDSMARSSLVLSRVRQRFNNLPKGPVPAGHPANGVAVQMGDATPTTAAQTHGGVVRQRRHQP